MGRKLRAGAWRRLRELRELEPRNRRELRRWVEGLLGLAIPERAVVEGNDAPLEYLVRAFLEGGDSLVWASRGSGKTTLGAVATLLEMIYFPGIQIRILGGSLEQSGRMFRYLVQFLERPVLEPIVVGEPTQRRVELVNRSGVEILAQSHRSVRGVRVHKLRCDELEEFEPEIWQAAQLVVQSGWCGGRWVQGSVEALSTMHRPFGLMSRVVERVQGFQGLEGAEERFFSGGTTRLFRWCALDVARACGLEQECPRCPLWADCQGRARNAQGFVPVEDLIAAWRRSSRETWASEMMCLKPSVSESVYPQFDIQRHVRVCGSVSEKENQETAGGGRIEYVAGMDFGLRSPLVMVLGRVYVEPEKSAEEWLLEIVDEYCERGQTLFQHLEAIQRRNWPKLAWVGVDPAGAQRNSHSGESDIGVLRRYGYRVRVRPSGLGEGIERIRRRLDHGLLVIDPQCRELIRAMREYHFDPRRPEREEPVKDGPDHAADALRYLVVNLEGGSSGVKVRRW